MLRRVALVSADISEELRASFIRVTRIGEVGTTLAVTSVLARVTRRHIPEDSILHSHRRENLKSYLVVFVCLFISPTSRDFMHGALCTKTDFRKI
jgi:hypothetical protein